MDVNIAPGPKWTNYRPVCHIAHLQNNVQLWPKYPSNKLALEYQKQNNTKL